MSFRRAIASPLMAVMAVHLGGCTTWKVQEPAPEQIVTEQAPDHIRVTKTDGTEIEIWEPKIVEDSVAGLTQAPLGAWAAGRRPPQKVPTAVLLDEIEHVAVRKWNWGVTAAIGAVIVIAAVVLAATADYGATITFE